MGEGDGVRVAVGDGVGVEVGVGDGVAVGTKVAVPEPGHVWDKRIPESMVLIVAKEPA